MCRLFGSDSEVMNSHDVERNKLTIHEGIKIIQVVEKNPTVTQNEIGKCLMLPLSSLSNIIL